MANVANLQLGVTETSIVAGGVTNRNVLSITFFNTSASVSQTVTVYQYPSGGSGSNSTTIKEFTLGARESLVIPKDQLAVLGNGETISGIATTAATVTVTVNYIDR
jgi:hypothetical protein